MLIKEKWRVGLIALRDIEKGEELSYDYQVRDSDWMKSHISKGGKVTDITELDGAEVQELANTGDKVRCVVLIPSK